MRQYGRLSYRQLGFLLIVNIPGKNIINKCKSILWHVQLCTWVSECFQAGSGLVQASTLCPRVDACTSPLPAWWAEMSMTLAILQCRCRISLKSDVVCRSYGNIYSVIVFSWTRCTHWCRCIGQSVSATATNYSAYSTCVVHSSQKQLLVVSNWILYYFGQVCRSTNYNRHADFSFLVLSQFTCTKGCYRAHQMLM